MKKEESDLEKTAEPGNYLENVKKRFIRRYLHIV